MSKRRRHDVAVTSITADMEDVVLTSAKEYRSFIDSAFVELHSGDWAYIVFDGKIFILAGIFSFLRSFHGVLPRPHALIGSAYSLMHGVLCRKQTYVHHYCYRTTVSC